MISFSGKIHLLTTNSELSMLTDLQKVKILGFDTETRPAFKKGEVYPVALLQLATNDEAFLIRLQKITEFQIIKSIFENPDLTKVGVAIRDDIRQLQKKFQFTPQNFVELQDLAKKNNLANFGLRGMTEEVLSEQLSKRAKITNWEAQELTAAQILYAATDAWIVLKLYEKLAVFR